MEEDFEKQCSAVFDLCVRALIDEAEIHLEHYGNQIQDVELRSPTELLQARRKVSDALELSETYDLTMMGESARLIERQTSDALTFWGEQRRQLIESVLAIDEDTIPFNPEFARVPPGRQVFDALEVLREGAGLSSHDGFAGTMTIANFLLGHRFLC